jgi:hypothetical protein
MEFRVFIAKRKEAQAACPMTCLNWNRANGLLARGYESGDRPGSTLVDPIHRIDFLSAIF